MPRQAEVDEDGLLMVGSRIKEADRFKDSSLMIYQACRKFDRQKQKPGFIVNGNKVTESLTCLIL